MAKILIIDDNPQTVECIAGMAEKLGHDTVYSIYSKHFFTLLEEDNYDLAVLDVYMPEVDGLTLLEQLRRTPEYQHLPVIMLTSDKDPAMLAKCLRSGANDFINKPLSEIAFAARIDSVLSMQEYIRKLTQTSNELDLLNAKKNRFFSILAHDLKAPFNGLLGFSELLMEDAGDMKTEEIVETATRINKAAGRIFNLLENLLEWTKIQMEGVSNPPEKLLVSDSISLVIDLFKDTARQKGILIECDCENGLYVNVSPKKLETILRNLVSNAIKFTQKDGKVWVEASKRDDRINITVEDTGIGIPDSDINGLFAIEKYNSRPGTKGEKGTGLGLLICKELVTKIGGTLEVSSTENEGTTFTLSLPSFSK